MQVKKTNKFLEIYIFLQFNSVGNMFERFISKYFALPVAVAGVIQRNIIHYGCYNENELIGLLIMNTHYNKINYLYVMKDCRKQGIGRKLVQSSKCDCVTTIKSSIPYWNELGFTKRVSRNLFLKESINEM